jgi:ankyrin repeat protein
MTEDYLEILTAVQEGDIDLLRTLVNTSDSSSSSSSLASSSSTKTLSTSKYDRNKMILLNQVDDNNCTLLHWAAINNRIEITNFLIDHGLIHAISGGILQETPLQWALRKKYYRIMNIIYTRSQCNLYHKSIHGYDALHLACRLGM